MSAITFSNSPSELPARIALLGCGNVGAAVARRILATSDRLHARLVGVLVRDVKKDRGVPSDIVFDRFEDVLDTRPDVVIEVLGGIDPALRHVSSALESGFPVVTANKTLIARHARELDAAAARGGTHLAYEAAVCAAIPVFAALRHLEGDRVKRVRGIVNGSCNFILTRMQSGASFEQALEEAKILGLVEPDPSADISGRDSAEKLCLLARSCGFQRATVDQIHVTGISAITSDDIRQASRTGHVIKLIAEFDAAAYAENPASGLRVGPTLLPRNHPLAQVNNEENALTIETELAGELFLKGKGAGPNPTASAVLGDVVRVLSGASRAPSFAAAQSETAGRQAGAGGEQTIHETRRRYHLRVSGNALTPDGVLNELKRHDIGASEIVLGRDHARVDTHAAPDEGVRACADALGVGLGSRTLLMPYA